MIVVLKRSSYAARARRGWTAHAIDVTSRADEPWVRLSPFFPHGGIPVPLSHGAVGASVEGIWQGLKVFEHEDVDMKTLSRTTMKGIKRPANARRGRLLGHRAGLGSTRLLGYLEARQKIYLPAYRYVLDHRTSAELASLREQAAAGDLVLLDYETNTDIFDLRRPLAHAALVACHVEGVWPGESPPGHGERDPIRDLLAGLAALGAPPATWAARLGAFEIGALQCAWERSRDPEAMLRLLERLKPAGTNVQCAGDRWTNTIQLRLVAANGLQLSWERCENSLLALPTTSMTRIDAEGHRDSLDDASLANAIRALVPQVAF